MKLKQTALRIQSVVYSLSKNKLWHVESVA